MRELVASSWRGRQGESSSSALRPISRMSSRSRKRAAVAMAPSSGFRQSSLLSFFSKPACSVIASPELHPPAAPPHDDSDSFTHESSCSHDQDGDSLTWSELLAGASWSNPAPSRVSSSPVDETLICELPIYEGSNKPHEEMEKRERSPRGASQSSKKKVHLTEDDPTEQEKPLLDSTLETASMVEENRDSECLPAHMNEKTKDDPEVSEAFVFSTERAQGCSEAVGHGALDSMAVASEPVCPDLCSPETRLPCSPSPSARDSMEGEAENQEGNLPDSANSLKLTRGKGRRVSAPMEPLEAPITDYERERAENILRNQTFLRKLGISPTSAMTAISRPTKPKGKVAGKPLAPVLPLRRSRRHLDAGELQTDAQTAEPNVSECIIDDRFYSYDDSAVLKYTCGDRVGSGVVQTYKSCDDIVGFRPMQRELQHPHLTRIYTMSAAFIDGNQRALLAAGGHQGQIAVFGTHVDVEECCEKEAASMEEQKHSTCSLLEGEASEEAGSLLSWKGSSGWISGVKFLSAQTQENAMLLLSSANDGNVVLWDINKQKTQNHGARLGLLAGSPLKVSEARSIHSNGIFAMHELGGRIATASKDSTIGYSKITHLDIIMERSISGHHSGAIRGVNFRDGDILADCGADGLICILDIRMADPCTLIIDTSNTTVVNMVEWCPSNENLILSASKDPHLFLHDIRNHKEHLHRLSGHVSPQLQRCSQIYRPAFVAQGRAVATPGQGSKSLSLYSVATGKAISRGFLGYDATMVMWTAQGDDASSLLWVAARHVAQLVPLWQSCLEAS